MSHKSDREELERRLVQVRRLTSTAQDSMTQERMAALVADIERQIANARERDCEA